VSDEQYISVAQLSELPQGKTLCVERDGKEILLCHTAEGIFAVDNLCTHGAARLCEGKLKGHRVLCPMHGAAFDVRDGSALTRPAVRGLGSYEVKVDGEEICLVNTDQLS
jgi:nitrite reductase/ring-hydroxylating ferredoxin subunit